MLTLTHMTGTAVPFRYCSESVHRKLDPGKSVGERVGDAVGGNDVGEADGGIFFCFFGKAQLDRTTPA